MIDFDSDPGSWARAIRQTPALAAQNEIAHGGAPLASTREGEAASSPPAASPTLIAGGRS